MKEKILKISKKLENNKITEQEAKEQLLFLFGIRKRFDINDDIVWDAVCELDELIPKYWVPNLAKDKPASYVREMREWLVKILNNALKDIF